MKRIIILAVLLPLCACRSYGPLLHTTADAAPVLTASCAQLTANVSGYPAGTAVFVELGSEPPYGFTVGTPDPWGRFTVTDDGGSGTVVVGEYNATHEFDAIVDVQIPNQDQVRLASIHVICD